MPDFRYSPADIHASYHDFQNAVGAGDKRLARCAGVKLIAAVGERQDAGQQGYPDATPLARLCNSTNWDRDTEAAKDCAWLIYGAAAREAGRNGVWRAAPAANEAGWETDLSALHHFLEAAQAAIRLIRERWELGDERFIQRGVSPANPSHVPPTPEVALDRWSGLNAAASAMRRMYGRRGWDTKRVDEIVASLFKWPAAERLQAVEREIITDLDAMEHCIRQGEPFLSVTPPGRPGTGENMSNVEPRGAARLQANTRAAHLLNRLNSLHAIFRSVVAPGEQGTIVWDHPGALSRGEWYERVRMEADRCMDEALSYADPEVARAVRLAIMECMEVTSGLLFSGPAAVRYEQRCAAWERFCEVRRLLAEAVATLNAGAQDTAAPASESSPVVPPIIAAQRVFDMYNAEHGRINGDESYARQILNEMRMLVREFPDAVSGIEAAKSGGLGPSAIPLSPAATALAWLSMSWAEGVLGEDPKDLADFTRWARHVGGLLPTRRRELLKLAGYDGVADESDKRRQEAAERIIDTAARLGIVGVVDRPTTAMTHAALWNVIDRLTRYVEGKEILRRVIVESKEPAPTFIPIVDLPMHVADVPDTFGPAGIPSAPATNGLTPDVVKQRLLDIAKQLELLYGRDAESRHKEGTHLQARAMLLYRDARGASLLPDLLAHNLGPAPDPAWNPLMQDWYRLAFHPSIIRHADDPRHIGEQTSPAWVMHAAAVVRTLAQFVARDAAGAAQPSGVPETNTPQPRAANARHNADFTNVEWFGASYTFALGVQSSAVKVLWAEWERSGMGLHQQTIRDQIDAGRDNFRMDTAFRNNLALGTMIRPKGSGVYALVPPDPPNRPEPPKSSKGRRAERKKKR